MDAFWGTLFLSAKIYLKCLGCKIREKHPLFFPLEGSQCIGVKITNP